MHSEEEGEKEGGTEADAEALGVILLYRLSVEELLRDGTSEGNTVVNAVLLQYMLWEMLVLPLREGAELVEAVPATLGEMDVLPV